MEIEPDIIVSLHDSYFAVEFSSHRARLWAVDNIISTVNIGEPVYIDNQFEDAFHFKMFDEDFEIFVDES